MFDEKEKRRFLAEGFRNLGIGFIIGGFVGAATNPQNLPLHIVISISGLLLSVVGWVLMDLKE